MRVPNHNMTNQQAILIVLVVNNVSKKSKFTHSKEEFCYVQLGY